MPRSIFGHGPVQQKVLQYLRDNGPSTCGEVGKKTEQRHDRVAATMRRLDTLVRKTGQRGGVENRSAVWEITPAGLEMIQAAKESA